MDRVISLQPKASLHSVVYSGADKEAARELRHLAELAGIDIKIRELGALPFEAEAVVAMNGAGASGVKNAVGAVGVTGEVDAEGMADVAGAAQGILNFTSVGCMEGKVIAYFHELFAPYFAKGKLQLDYRQDVADILELMVAVGATVRGKIVGIIGAQGGCGVSVFALWLASYLAGKEKVAVIDMDPGSAGNELLLGAVDVPGKRWADLQGAGSLLAGRLETALPEQGRIKFLSADTRGSVPLDNELGIKAISALAQVNDWTILDLAPSAPVSPQGKTWLEWCDYILLMTDTSIVALAQAELKLQQLRGEVPVALVAVEAKSKNQIAYIKTELQFSEVYRLRYTRNFIADIEYGIIPGERKKSQTEQDVRRICREFLQVGNYG